MENTVVKVRCQRIGCNAMFSDDDNLDGSCQYHDLGPTFHDGCKTGKHTTEKQVIAPAKKKPVPPPSVASSTNASTKDSCSRCRQGFFCSDHASQSKPVTIVGDKSENLAGDASAESNSKVEVVKPPKKIVGINKPQICKNKGCGQTFKEKDNHDTACSYHPGPAVFHDRMRGWKCCDIHVKEFDEFMSIPPCTKGWHNADPEP